MLKILPIVLCSLFLAFLSNNQSKYTLDDNGRKVYYKKEKLFYFIMAASLAIFVGLRTRGNDTYAYRQMYEGIDAGAGSIGNIDWLNFSAAPGLQFLSILLKKLGASTQDYFMLTALITNGIYLWFIRKYSYDIPFSVFLFVATGMFTFTMAAIKQCVAMAICLVAIDRAVQKKYIFFVLWVLLAALYHPYALMYLVVPFLLFRPWSVNTVIMLAAFAVAGMVLDQLIGTIVDVTDLLGESFDAASFTGEGVNPFRVAVVAVPVLIAFVTRRVIAQIPDRVQYLMVNLAMLNAEIMFVGLFGTANYFARLANYFLLFQAMSMPWLLTHFEVRSRRLMTWGALAGYGAFYLFSYAIMDNFDYHYASVSVWDYLRSLF